MECLLTLSIKCDYKNLNKILDSDIFKIDYIIHKGKMCDCINNCYGIRLPLNKEYEFREKLQCVRIFNSNDDISIEYTIDYIL